MVERLPMSWVAGLHSPGAQSCLQPCWEEPPVEDTKSCDLSCFAAAVLAEISWNQPLVRMPVQAEPGGSVEVLGAQG